MVLVCWKQQQGIEANQKITALVADRNGLGHHFVELRGSSDLPTFI